jgi:RHS repeat-associated protein
MVQSTVSGTTTRMRYGAPGDSGANYETNASGTVTQSHLAGLADYAGGVPTYTLMNPHGDVAIILNQAGAVTSVSLYDEYGNPEGSTGLREFGYLGSNEKVTDANTGTILMGLRRYRPQTGRFLQVDPVDGGSCNDYDDVCADPINSVDLNGTCVEDACVAEGFTVETIIMHLFIHHHSMYHVPPRTLPAFPGARRVRPKTGRYRWEDEDYIYEWDSQHGRVEKYSKKTGKHLGEFDPKTGRQTKPARKDRRTMR